MWMDGRSCAETGGGFPTYRNEENGDHCKAEEGDIGCGWSQRREADLPEGNCSCKSLVKVHIHGFNPTTKSVKLARGFRGLTLCHSKEILYSETTPSNNNSNP